MKRFEFHVYDCSPRKDTRCYWSLNILPIIQIAYFKHESVELVLGWIFWEFEIRFLLEEKV
jgi:hypothetical protein